MSIKVNPLLGTRVKTNVYCLVGRCDIGGLRHWVCSNMYVNYYFILQ